LVRLGRSLPISAAYGFIMATRLSVITTRGGDDGTTGLGDGTRVSKNHARIHAMGEVDELNCVLGLLRTEALPVDVDRLVYRVQNELFDLGAELCIPGHVVLGLQHVAGLDDAIAHYNADLGKLQEFILPGGCRAAALAHLARGVCRRAERAVVALESHEGQATTDEAQAPGGDGQATDRERQETDDGHRPHVRQYLNRLSDLCFVLARVLNRAAGTPDVQWQRHG